MSFIKKHGLFFLFLFGLLIRLALIFVNFSFDVNNHIVWAKDLHLRGFLGFFDRPSSEKFAVAYPNYPPLSLFIFYLFYPLPKIIFDFFWFLNVRLPLFPSNFVSMLESIDQRLFLAAMLKLPAILADLGLTWILVLFTRKIIPKTKKFDLLVASLILFNPVFINNSSLWGQIDVIPLFFIMVSFYFLLFTKKNILSGVFFTLSLLVKPTTLVFLPVYLVVFLQRYGWFNVVKTIIVSNLVFWLAFLPFLKKFNLLTPYYIYSEKILAAQSLPYVTNGAFNFWLILVDFKQAVLDTAPFLFGLSYRFWGYFLTGVIIVVVLYRMLKNKVKTEVVFSGLFFSALASVLFLTKMHERYFLLPLPFLLLMVINKKQNLKYFFLLSALAFLNHYHSWAVPYIKIVYETIDNLFVYKSLSLINLLVFLYLFNKQRL